MCNTETGEWIQTEQTLDDSDAPAETLAEPTKVSTSPVDKKKVDAVKKALKDMQGKKLQVRNSREKDDSESKMPKK